MDTEAYVQALYGKNAVSVPFNAIVQSDPNDDAVVAVVVIRGEAAKKLLFGGTATHQLIIGDAVIRPHFVFESDHLAGTGISGLAKTGFEPDGWIEKGRVIIDHAVRPDILTPKSG